MRSVGNILPGLPAGVWNIDSGCCVNQDVKYTTNSTDFKIYPVKFCWSFSNEPGSISQLIRMDTTPPRRGQDTNPACRRQVTKNIANQYLVRFSVLVGWCQIISFRSELRIENKACGSV